MVAVYEVSLICNDCGQLFDCRLETLSAARDSAREHGWRKRYIDGEVRDLCPGCLTKRGLRTLLSTATGSRSQNTVRGYSFPRRNA